MATPSLQIHASAGTHDGQKVLRLIGPLNIHTIFEFQTAVRAETSPTLIVDFSDVPFIDSIGLGALVSAQLTTKRANRKLALAAMNPRVRALLGMSNLTQFFSAYPTTQEAESALS